MTINIQNASIINVEGIRTNKHCKAVYCITNGKIYASVSYAAKAMGVSQGFMSWVLADKSRKRTCKGMRFCFVDEIIEYIDEIAEVNRANEAKAMAYDKMIAKQNKIREVKARIDEHDAVIMELNEKLNKEIELRTKANDELYALQHSED